jgi:uncharacterized protein (DUF983 family)
MIDTDGILDRCAECGERAVFHVFSTASYVQCSECANATDFFRTKAEAMAGWNITQREAKARKEAGV